MNVGCEQCRRLIVLTNLLQRPQHLADLEDLVHLTVAGEQGSEGVEFRHDATHSPEVDGGAVGGGSQQDLRSAVPAQQSQDYKNENISSLTYDGIRRPNKAQFEDTKVA